MLALAVAIDAPAEAADARTIVVLYSDQALNPGPARFADGLRESLASASPPIQVEAQHLQVARVPGESGDAALAEWLRSRYRDRAIPVVVALGAGASLFASEHVPTIWPGARIVHAAVDDRAARASRPVDLVIPRILDSRGTMERALALFPGTRQIWLVAGATDADRRWLSEAAASLAPLAGRVEIEAVAGLRWDDLLARIRHMPEDAVALAVSFFGDADGRGFVPGDAMAEISRTANRPVFVTQPLLVGRGSLGGRILDVALIGRLAGTAARQMVEFPGAAVPAVEPAQLTQWTFDAVQLQRWGLRESLLPTGSVVVNRELPFWRRHFWPLLATVLLVLAQGAIIAALLVQRRQRRKVEGALRESEETARARYHEVRDLAGRLITAREGERTRIARDLHDDIGQRIASLSISLSRIRRQIPDASAPARQSLSTLEEQAAKLSADLRHLSHELHPGTLEHLGLLDALRERCDDFTQASGVPVRFDVSDGWRDVPDAIALCLYRVAQEALRNVATHARARHVTMSLDQCDDRLVMRVADDGCGFEPAAVAARRGLGLTSLSERVRMLGGALDITAEPERGTRLAVSLPVGAAHAS